MQVPLGVLVKLSFYVQTYDNSGTKIHLQFRQAVSNQVSLYICLCGHKNHR